MIKKLLELYINWLKEHRNNKLIERDISGNPRLKKTKEYDYHDLLRRPSKVGDYVRVYPDNKRAIVIRCMSDRWDAPVQVISRDFTGSTATYPQWMLVTDNDDY